MTADQLRRAQRNHRILMGIALAAIFTGFVGAISILAGLN